MPWAPRREGLATVGMVAANQIALCTAPAPVRQLQGQRSRLYRWDALCRGDGGHVRGAWRVPWRVHGVGSNQTLESLVHHGTITGLEWSSRNRWRRRVLRDDGPTLQSRGCKERQGSVASARAF